MAQTDRFIYAPLGYREIRLITLLPSKDSEKVSCTLHHASLDALPHYETLSYVWGTDDMYGSILVNGKSFGVRRNLWLALYYLRGLEKTMERDLREDETLWATNVSSEACFRNDVDRITANTTLSCPSQGAYLRNNSKKLGKSYSKDPSSTTDATLSDGTVETKESLIIWIDPISINQYDILERSAQVQLMGDIYERGARLRIWLGEHTSNTIAAIENFIIEDIETKLFLDCKNNGSPFVKRGPLN